MANKKKKRTKPKPRTLTPKQLNFIALYNGNGVDSARLSGYGGSDASLAVIAYENLRNPQIVLGIRKRQDVEPEVNIAPRSARQKFWTKVLSDPKSSMNNRLKASELLGKSEGDFIDVIKIPDPVKVTVITATEEQLEQAFKKSETDC